MYISGNNHSDDLFMYYKRRIGSLRPGGVYAITFDVEFASMYPDGSIGIGGSPANSVFFKAGATNIRMMCIVASPEGAQRMLDDHPDVPVYAAALDRELNDRGYILPGLGDAGDRLFGTD